MRERPRTWQQAERRALVADLVRTQATLQARSEQLQEIFASRWYRLARFAWRLRRGSVLRKPSPPRMAGEDSFTRPLDGDLAVAEETEVRLVPAPSGDVEVDLERRRWLAGARMPGLEGLRVAAILDEASAACLAPECDLDTRFGPHDWRERLESRPPHMLLVESAWAGNGGGWLYGVASYPDSPQAGLPALSELVAWCRERGIPSVFWNTQDPLHFDRFAAAAALFDQVFTVDANRIAAYRHFPGAAARGVGALPFAAQPRLHNPVAVVEERRREPAFAGAYDRGWPDARRRELEGLLDAARPFGLVVYERRLGAAGAENGLPERFRPHVAGRRSYAETVDAYKRHRVFLNADPVAGSPTMLSRRVFELLACGTAVLSAPSAGIEAILGDLVPVARGEAEASEQLERLLDDEGSRRELTGRGRRHVLARHTYRDRLAELAEAVGFDLPAGEGEEVAVLLVADQPDQLGAAVDSLLAQSLAPREVLVGLPAGASAERRLDRLAERFEEARIRTVSQDRDASRSERLRELARLAISPWVAPLAPTPPYERHHLRDLVACTRFAEAQVIGFGAASRGGPHRYVDAVAPDAALAARGTVAARGWPGDEAAMRGWFSRGVRIYAGEDGGGAAEEDGE
jgi:Glycosyl transferases group 1